MLENLQKGDKLTRKEVQPGFTPVKFEHGVVLAVCGDLVALQIEDEENDNNWAWWTYKVLKDYGWQIEKKEWVPKLNEKYWNVSANGEIGQLTFFNDDFDKFRLLAGNCFSTKDAAEVYRNKLVEVMGKEGVCGRK